jgi:hypothetical protein
MTILHTNHPAQKATPGTTGVDLDPFSEQFVFPILEAPSKPHKKKSKKVEDGAKATSAKDGAKKVPKKKKKQIEDQKTGDDTWEDFSGLTLNEAVEQYDRGYTEQESGNGNDQSDIDPFSWAPELTGIVCRVTSVTSTGGHKIEMHIPPKNNLDVLQSLLDCDFTADDISIKLGYQGLTEQIDVTPSGSFADAASYEVRVRDAQSTAVGSVNSDCTQGSI